jgi:hypothetical protein
VKRSRTIAHRRRELVLQLPILAWLAIVPSAETSSVTCRAQEIVCHRYAQSQIRDDFDLLVAALEEAHPGIDRYSPRGAFRFHMEALRERISGPMTEFEFLPLVYAAIAAIRDGHTFARPSVALASALADMRIRLPFRIRLLGGEAFIERDYRYPTSGELAGARVRALNGVPMTDLVHRMLDWLPADAGIESARYRALEREATFSFLLGLIEKPMDIFEVEVDGPGGAPLRRVAVKGLTGRELERRVEAANVQAMGPQLPIELSWQDAVPVLTVRTFSGSAYERCGIDFADFLRDAFSEVGRRGARVLVIDVRDNGGGRDEYGKILVAHLMNRTFDYYRSLQLNAPRFKFQRYTNLPEGPVTSLLTEGDRLQANDKGTFDLLGHPNLGRQSSRDPAFDGRIFVLQNGRSFSVTAEFAAILKQNTEAVFIGEETGGGRMGNVSGASLELTLPHTGIRVSIPFVRYDMAVSARPGPERGVTPDHAIEPTISDVLGGRDVVLEYALTQARRAMVGPEHSPQAPPEKE